MTTTSPKLGTLRFALLAAPLLVAACRTSQPAPAGLSNHWSVDSVPERIAQHFTGYRRDRNGEYIDYQYEKKKHISLTLRRHFMNNDPDSPFEPEDPSRTGRRPDHSVLPDPIYYINAEGVATGIVLVGTSGAFVPIPVDSLIATTFGGWGEFWDGITGTFTGGGEAEAEKPVGTSKFKVKNR